MVKPPDSQDLYIQSYPASGKVERITTGGARRPQWDPRKNTLRLYYLAGGVGNTMLNVGGALKAVTFTQFKGQITWEIEEVLPETDGHHLERVGKDGRLLIMEAMSRTEEYGRFIHIANFLDWLEELDRGR